MQELRAGPRRLCHLRFQEPRRPKEQHQHGKSGQRRAFDIACEGSARANGDEDRRIAGVFVAIVWRASSARFATSRARTRMQSARRPCQTIAKVATPACCGPRSRPKRRRMRRALDEIRTSDRCAPAPTPRPYKATFVKGPPNPQSFWRERGSQHEGRNIRPLHNAGTIRVYRFPNRGANVATLMLRPCFPPKGLWIWWAFDKSCLIRTGSGCVTVGKV